MVRPSGGGSSFEWRMEVFSSRGEPKNGSFHGFCSIRRDGGESEAGVGVFGARESLSLKFLPHDRD